MKRLCLLSLVLSVACGDDDRSPFDGAVSPDGSLADAAVSDAPFDGAPSDAPGSDGSPSDAGSDGAPSDAPATTDAAASDAGSNATIELTFSGCAPDFSGDVVVIRNAESIAVTATSSGAFGGSVQLALQDERGTVTLSSQHRVDTGAVVNVLTPTTWTNLAMDSAGVLTGSVADPIGGTLTVTAYDEAAGILDIGFAAVTLQNPSDGTICQVDGRLRTSGLSF